MTKEKISERDKKTHKVIKWVMGLIITTHLMCFFPGDMIPLPLIILELNLLDGLFEWGYTWQIVSHLIILGQILAMISLTLKRGEMTLIMGLLATILLVTGNILWLMDEHLSFWSVEVTTSIPFALGVVLFWGIGIKSSLSKKVELNNGQ